MLFSGNTLFINGEPHDLTKGTDADALRHLADERRLANSHGLGGETLDRLYEWYENGFLAPATTGKT